MDGISLEAMAKINLGLDVLRRREDGYHEVKMVMQTVGICDRLEFNRRHGSEIRIRTDKAQIPCDEGNLVYKAIRMVRETYHIPDGMEVCLEKNIPIAAGMAGGSTDAAAAIHAMDRLFGLGLSLEEKQKIGVRIGADVPYCLLGGTALCEGIGEVLTPLPAAPQAFLVVAKPEVDVSTKLVYENLHIDRLTQHPDIDGMVDSIRGGDLAGISGRLGNVLETVTAKRYPVIAQIKAFLIEQGALGALMSGSGPTVFGIFKEKEKAREAYEAVVGRGFTRQVYLTAFAGKANAG